MNEWEWQLLEENVRTESIAIGGMEVKQGDRVRLRPREGGDIFDLALAGQTAMVEAIEQDYEGKLHLAVVLDEDPGKDLGLLRQPGHRFFFSAEEVEPLETAALRQPPAGRPRILIAGIGNIFLGDDGFGVEVAQQLQQMEWPSGVTIRDFGIRSYDLAYALLDGYDLVVLVDATPRRSAPGTLYVIEPDLDAAPPGSPALDAHAMNPVSVLQLAKSMGPVSGRTVLVGCEPATLGGENGHMGLSGPVAAAVDEAARMVRKLVGITRGIDRRE